MSVPFLAALRNYELDLITPIIAGRKRVLELGAGAGWQAQALAERGHVVSAIDVESSEYSSNRVWSVELYDGHHIPFGDAEFDVVYSSNVLEHIPHVVGVQSEIQRVLKPGGRVVHVLPSATWRFWTSVTYYARRLRSVPRITGLGESSDDSSAGRSRGLRDYASRLLPGRHGEQGNFLSEIYLFSRFRWRRLFRSCGWTVLSDEPTGLFYTGYNVFGGALSISMRQRLSHLLGSACRIYVLAMVGGDDRG